MSPQSEATCAIVTQETMDQVFGSLKHSEDSMGKALTELREMKQLLREHNVLIENQNSILGSLAGVWQDCLNNLVRAMPIPSTPLCVPSASVVNTSAPSTEREALSKVANPPQLQQLWFL